jgi:enoyl-CoA hydratase/carnithine racemase
MASSLEESVQTITLERNDSLAVMRLTRGHGNAINSQLVDELIAACATAENDSSIRGVKLASSGKLFCPGLDLVELSRLERPEMEEFLERFQHLIRTLYTFPKPMVAQLHGHAVAGGCVLALTADWRMIAEGAMVGLNEVRVGVPFPYGVAQILRESAPSGKVEEVALFGRNYRGQEAIGAGLVHEVHAADALEAACDERLQELASKDPGAFRVTKRYLRSPVVERIQQHERALKRDFIDAWFSDSTRALVGQIVAELTKKK